MDKYRIAVIPGDGIGKEVVPEGVKALEALASRFDLAFEFEWFNDWNCERYMKQGEMMPPDGVEQVSEFDAISSALEKEGIQADSAELAYIPGSVTAITDKDTVQKLLRLTNALDDLDDVQNVFDNSEIDPSLLDD